MGSWAADGAEQWLREVTVMEDKEVGVEEGNGEKDGKEAGGRCRHIWRGTDHRWVQKKVTCAGIVVTN